MSDDRRRLIQDAESLGFSFVGQTPRGGHLQFVHENGKRVVAASTPSDWRGWANARKEMERASGRHLPREGNGNYTFKPTTRLNLKQSETETRNSEKIDRLLDRVGVIRSEFGALALSPSSRSAQSARRLLDEFNELREELAIHHRIVDPIY